jgi:hypothetical protein
MSSIPLSWPTDTVEFFVARYVDANPEFFCVPVDQDVQSLLEEMLARTLKALAGDGSSEIEEYEFAERYKSVASLRKSLDHDALARVKELLQIQCKQIDAAATQGFEAAAFYMVRFHAADGSSLVAVRRASYFKAILKQRNRLVRLVDDTLCAVEDRLFKLDSDFDFVIAPEDVYILRPGNFEVIAGVEDIVVEKIPEKVDQLKSRIPFLDFTPVAGPASQKKRLARLLSSVAARKDLESIVQDEFLALATQTQVSLEFKDGRYMPTADSIKGFLELLDRRRYHISLKGDGGEAFVASSRQPISAP